MGIVRACISVFYFIAFVASVPQAGAADSDTLSFSPSEDAQVKSTSPASNYGDKSSFKVERNLYNAYLRFRIVGISGAVQSARLRLFVQNGSDEGGELHLVSGTFLNSTTPWTENQLTWETAPEINSSAVSTVGQVTAGTFAEFDLTGIVTGDGEYNFGLQTDSMNRAQYTSKEGDFPPELLVITGAGHDGPNIPPVANSDLFLSSDPGGLTVPAPGVLANDTDADHDALTALVASDPGHGNLTMNPDGSFVYSSTPGFLGTDKFDYTVSDGHGGTNLATVTVIITANGGDRAQIIEPVVSTEPTTGIADDPAIWLNRTDPARSLIFGTDKVSGVYVWDMDGHQIQHLDQGTATNNIDVRQDVLFNGEMVDMVAANLRDVGKLAVFIVNSDYTKSDALIQIAGKDDAGNDIQSDSYGLALYRRPSDAALFVVDKPKKHGAVRQYRLTASDNGEGVLLTPTRDLDYDRGIAEGFVADDELGFLYITEEDKGIHKYFADPDLGNQEIAFFAQDDGIVADREGVAVYHCSDGTGYILLSSQGNSTVKIYERQGDNRFVKTIIPVSGDGDYSLGSDGLDVTSFATSSKLQNGFLIMHDEDGSRFHLFDWQEVAGNDLTVCVDGTSGGESNHPPMAGPDSAATTANTPVIIDVLANDLDEDGTLQPSSVEIATPPVHGTVAVNSGTGALTYSPTLDFTGHDELFYTVEDNQGAISNPGRVSLTIVANDAEVTTSTFRPIADAQVKTSSPENNYGDKPSFKLDAPIFHSYLKFQVAGITGTIQEVKLRLFVLNSSDDGGGVYLVLNNFKDSSESWDENTLNFSNAPILGGSPVATAGAVKSGTTTEFDLTGTVAGNGIYSFGLLNQSSDKAEYSSKEGDNPPLLLITFGTDSGSGNLAPVASDDSTSTPQGVNAVINILANDSDPDGEIDPTSVAITTGPQHGAVVVNPFSGIVSYKPEDTFSGQDAFSYTVQDREGALSNTATVHVAILGDAAPTTLAFQPTDDAQIKSSAPAKNYGDKASAKSENEIFRALLKFQVSGVQGTVQKAQLRLFVVSASEQPGDIYTTANNYQDAEIPWREDELTWANAPTVGARAGNAVTARAERGSFVIFDLTATVTGNGIYSFTIINPSTDKVEYATKESAHQPELILEVAGNITATSTEPSEIIDGLQTTGVTPKTLSMSPNYPNPFNMETVFRYALPERDRVELIVYNIRGQRVRTLVDDIQPAGFRQISWNGRDDFGREVSSGIYFVRLSAHNQVLTNKIILQK